VLSTNDLMIKRLIGYTVNVFWRHPDIRAYHWSWHVIKDADVSNVLLTPTANPKGISPTNTEDLLISVNDIDHMTVHGRKTG